MDAALIALIKLKKLIACVNVLIFTALYICLLIPKKHFHSVENGDLMIALHCGDLTAGE